MVEKINGYTNEVEVLTDGCELYTVFTTLGIAQTSDREDYRQKNFDRLMSVISFRAQPVKITKVDFVTNLHESGAPTLKGPGYTFSFGIEVKSAYEGTKGIKGPVGDLIESVDETLQFIAKGKDRNIEFLKI